jgi:Fic family protein
MLYNIVIIPISVYNIIGVDVMVYKSVKEMANKWGISERRVRILCSDGRIEGVIKVGRSWNIPADATKPIDFRTKNTLPFLGLTDYDFSSISKLHDRLDSLRPLSHIQLKMIKEDMTLRWTYHSNAIEGNTLTLKETKVALEGITIGGKTITEHLEAINHKEAIDYLEEVSVNKLPLTERLIKELHYLILKQIDSKNAGVYRKENVIISGAIHKPPKYLEVPTLMEKLVHDYNNSYKNFHPVVKAALLLGEFVKIHPFVDGSGRTARILLNFCLMQEGLIPVVVTKEQRLLYYDALDEAHTTLDYTKFIEMIKRLLLDELAYRLSILE